MTSTVPALAPGDYEAAAALAVARYPGPVGELLGRELREYARFGHRFAVDADALMPILTAYLLAPDGSADLPTPRRRAPGPELWPRPGLRSSP